MLHLIRSAIQMKRFLVFPGVDVPYPNKHRIQWQPILCTENTALKQINKI